MPGSRAADKKNASPLSAWPGPGIGAGMTSSPTPRPWSPRLDPVLAAWATRLAAALALVSIGARTVVLAGQGSVARAARDPWGVPAFLAALFGQDLAVALGFLAAALAAAWAGARWPRLARALAIGVGASYAALALWIALNV